MPIFCNSPATSVTVVRRTPIICAKKLLREGKIIADEIMHAQQPLAGPGLNVMDCIAGRRLLHLCQKELLVAEQQPSETRKLFGDFADAVRTYDRRHASNLHDDVIERHPIVERLTGPERAVSANHAGLDCVAAFKLDDARDDPGMWEVHLFDALLGLCEHLGMVQIGQRKMRHEPVQYVRLKPV